MLWCLVCCLTPCCLAPVRSPSPMTVTVCHLVGGPHRTDARVRYKSDGCENFVGIVLCNALRQRSVDFLNSGCVPVFAQFSGGLRRFREENDASSSSAQPVDRVCVGGLLLHQAQEGVSMKPPPGEWAARQVC